MSSGPISIHPHDHRATGGQRAPAAAGRRGLSTVVVGLALLLAGAGTAAAQTAAALEPVAARDLPRGVALTAEDIRWEAVDRSRGADPGVGPGWTTRRVIGEGEPLRPPAVTPPLLVAHGDPVDVVVRRGAVLLRLRGTAIGGAAEGDEVTVRIDSRRRVRGIAAGPGIVQINGASR